MKNIIKNSGLAVFCAISTFSGVTLAQGDSAPAPRNMGFQKLDANGDGFLSKTLQSPRSRTASHSDAKPIFIESLTHVWRHQPAFVQFFPDMPTNSGIVNGSSHNTGFKPNHTQSGCVFGV